MMVVFSKKELETIKDLCVTTLETLYDGYDDDELVGDEEVWKEFCGVNMILDKLEESGMEMPTTIIFLSGRKFYRDNNVPDKGAFWDMTGEELFEDFKLYREADPEASVTDYVEEFEHQEGPLNPESKKRLYELAATGK